MQWAYSEGLAACGLEFDVASGKVTAKIETLYMLKGRYEWLLASWFKGGFYFLLEPQSVLWISNYKNIKVKWNKLPTVSSEGHHRKKYGFTPPQPAGTKFELASLSSLT